MKLFFSEAQLAHRPTQYMCTAASCSRSRTPNVRRRCCGHSSPLASSARSRRISGSTRSSRCTRPITSSSSKAPMRASWSCRTTGPKFCRTCTRIAAPGPDLANRGRPRTTGILGQAGWYIGDLSCAMTEGTFAAAYASAQTAVSGAEAVLAGDYAFALCRPPGHHAYADRASGFCYFNNAAIAAQTMRRTFSKVAIVDFDTHHGDGTQAIFYDRADVFYGSVHTDPSSYYPHYFGYADETGYGEGEGANLNLPLAPGAEDEAFIDANQRLALAVQGHGAEALVISAGWDAHREDPLSKLAVTTGAYGRIGEIWGKLGLPTLIVQEGGYSLKAVAEAAPEFVEGFRAAAGA